MKHSFLVLVLAMSLQACGTVKGTTSGFLDGASHDLKSLSEKVK